MIACFGCSSQPPQEEQKAATQAMEQAKQVQADKLAALDWGNATQAFNDAELMVKKSRMADAKMFYTRAKARFDKAQQIAASKQDSLMKEVDEARTAISSHYATVKAAVTGGKVPAKMKKDLEATCLEIDKSIADVDQAVSQRDAIKAKLTSQDLLKKVYATEQLIQKK